MHELKGISEPMQIYTVHHENTARSRLDSDPSGVDRLPVIGRTEEVKRIMDLWKDAKKELSHIVLLSGEAGVGKSPLSNNSMLLQMRNAHLPFSLLLSKIQ